MLRHILPLESPAGREIDNHYHLAVIAKNTESVKSAYSEMLSLQENAARTATAMHRMAGGVSDGFAHLSSQIADLTSTCDRWFEEVAEALLEQSALTARLVDVLRSPKGTLVRELRDKVDHAIEAGMTSNNEDRCGWFEAAYRTLEHIVDDPYGSHDYVAWFQLGYIHWKLHRNLDAAEKALAQSALLSSGARTEDDPGRHFYANATRHLGQVLYEEGRPGEAYERCVRVAGTVEVSPFFRFDTARFAAAAGDWESARVHLRKALIGLPALAISMHAERDFAGYSNELIYLEHELNDRLADETARLLERADRLVHFLGDATAQDLPFSAVYVHGVESSRRELESYRQRFVALPTSDASYVEVRALAEDCIRAWRTVRTLGDSGLTEALQNCQTSLREHQSDLDALLKQREERIKDVELNSEHTSKENEKIIRNHRPAIAAFLAPLEIQWVGIRWNWMYWIFFLGWIWPLLPALFALAVIFEVYHHINGVYPDRGVGWPICAYFIFWTVGSLFLTMWQLPSVKRAQGVLRSLPKQRQHDLNEIEIHVRPKIEAMEALIQRWKQAEREIAQLRENFDADFPPTWTPVAHGSH